NSIHLAALNGHDKVLGNLLDDSDKAALNVRDGKGRTPLMWGCLVGHKEVVQMLLDKGADVNTQGGEYGNALHAASHQGHKEVVQMLLDKGADVNTRGG
ncbi:ankyrin repeat-containing domain protein, partial [Diaporthe sp. PMI_573]